MESKEFKLRTPLQIFKAIRFKATYPKSFIGHLYYIRTIYNEQYFKEKNDILDEAILKALKNHFPESYFSLSDVLYWPERMEACSIQVKGGIHKNPIFYLIEYTWEAFQKNNSVKSYPIFLTMSFWMDSNPENIEILKDHLVNEFVITLPVDPNSFKLLRESIYNVKDV